MRRTAGSPLAWYMPRQRAPICDPALSAVQQLLCAEGRFAGPVFIFNAVSAACLSQVLAQQLASLWIEQADLPGIPLHLHSSSDPSGRCAVISCLNFHTAVQMDRALSI